MSALFIFHTGDLFLPSTLSSKFLPFSLALIIGLFSFLACKEIKLEKEKSAEIVIFSKDSCVYCLMAKGYLRKKNLRYKEIKFKKNSAKDLSLLKSMIKQTHSKLKKNITVPQIFIGNNHIGGFNDLVKLTDKKLKDFLSPL